VTEFLYAFLSVGAFALVFGAAYALCAHLLFRYRHRRRQRRLWLR